MPELPPCRGYPFLSCEWPCINESCERMDSCRASVLIAGDGQIALCDLKPHKVEVKHHAAVREFYGEVMIEMTWPSKPNPLNKPA